MKCIILAAGYATRLYPLTENYPKPLLEVGGKPILDWLIHDVSGSIYEFVVVSNHKFSPQFREWSSGHKEKITVIDDGTGTNETRLGAVRDIQLAYRSVSSVSSEASENWLVMAGDNVLDFSLVPFIEYGQSIGTSCVMCHDETSIPALQKTAVITLDENDMITSYEEKPKEPKGTLAVPPFYIYRNDDIRRIGEALEDGCGYDAPGSFAAWLSKKTPMHAWRMNGSRHDIGDMKSYEAVRDSYRGPRVV